MIFYSDEEAERVAEDFFKYHYVDRGKMKWQGFILSEQTAALKKNKHQSREEELDGLRYVKTKYDQA